MKYIGELNNNQKEAVLHKDGPVLILAGAGAGKTRVITYRILHLINEGVDGNRILAITFTNKAAKEMRERVDLLLANERHSGLLPHKLPYLSTFHSLGVRILRDNAEAANIPRHFSIYDRSDSKRALREAIKQAGHDPKKLEPGQILSAISRQKGDLVTQKDYAKKIGNDYFPNIISSVWKNYENILEKERSLDFDDLLLKTAILFRKNKDVLKRYQDFWHYLHIDEYQDTNKVQYEIARCLAGEKQNICAVGDIDQNIYSFRGADIQNILSFEKDFPKAKVILLEENYRSTQTILSAANDVIRKNTMRREKNLFTRNNEGEKIGLYQAYDEKDEADFVATTSKELIKSGVPADEIAVLYRANFQSRALEQAFFESEVPYQLLGVRFFDRKEIKDVLSYIRASLNPDSRTDIARIINVPKRGIGKVTLEKLFSNRTNELNPATSKKVSVFYGILESIKEKAYNSKPSDLIKFTLTATGIEQGLKSGVDEDLDRLENLGELITLAKKYDVWPQPEGTERLLEDAALATDQDSLTENRSGVKLMTVHASKGLEFDYVFITGLEDKLFPHIRSQKEALDQSEEEEERRLFYVALTRSRKKLFLTLTQVRTLFGRSQVNLPSEFLSDIDDAFLEEEGGRSTGSGKTIYLDDF
jgi:DNA helicase II / ATP-dependent DNA helicase PcrA